MATKPKAGPARKPAAPRKGKPDVLPMPKRKPAAPKPRAVPAKPKQPKPAAEPIDFASPAYLAAYDAETARISGEQVQDVYRLKSEWETAHEKAAGLKKEYEAHRSEHLAYVRDRIHKRGKRPDHLFAEVEARETIKAAEKNGKAKPKGKRGQKGGTGAGVIVPNPGEKDPNAWYPDTLWQRYPLDRLKPHGLTDGDLKALEVCGVPKGRSEPFPPIKTVGDLARFTEPKGGGFAFKLTDIAGIGPKSVERIEKATTAFWQDWPGELQQLFAVEQGYRRPDPLAEGADDADASKPADGGGPGTAGNGDGAGTVDGSGGVPFGDHKEGDKPTATV